MEGTSAVTWCTSSYSGSNGGQCIEVGNDARLTAVRDSTDPDGSVLAFAAGTWAAFAKRVKAGP
jgi:hypothetical protein